MPHFVVTNECLNVGLVPVFWNTRIVLRLYVYVCICVCVKSKSWCHDCLISVQRLHIASISLYCDVFDDLVALTFTLEASRSNSFSMTPCFTVLCLVSDRQLVSFTFHPINRHIIPSWSSSCSSAFSFFVNYSSHNSPLIACPVRAPWSCSFC